MSNGHFRNASWGGFVAAVKAGVGLISALLAVRLLGVEQFGFVATWLSLFVLFLSLISSAFTMLVVKMYSAAGECQQIDREIVTVAALRLCIAAVVVLTIVAAIIYSLTILFAIIPESYLTLLSLMCLLTAIQIVVALNAAVIEGAGRLDIAVRWQLIGPVIITVGLLYCFLNFNSLRADIYLLILSSAALIDMIFIWRIRRNLGLVFVSKSVGHTVGVFKLLRSGGLLQLTSLLNLFLEPVNKSLLNHYAGAASVAVYDLAMKVVWGIQHLVGAAMRVFVHIGSQDQSAVGRTFAKVFALLCVPVIGMHIVGALFLSWLAHYWLEVDGGKLMIFFSLATLSNLGMIFVTPLYLSLIGANDLLFILRVQALLAIINVAVSSLTVPLFGLIGAAFGLIIATALNVVSIYRRCKMELAVMHIFQGEAPHAKARLFFIFLLLTFTVLWAMFDGSDPRVFCFVFISLTLIMSSEPLVVRMITKITSKNPNLDM
jgi:O-antigen/teichoic acid export membrane protein